MGRYPHEARQIDCVTTTSSSLQARAVVVHEDAAAPVAERAVAAVAGHAAAVLAAEHVAAPAAERAVVAAAVEMCAQE